MATMDVEKTPSTADSSVEIMLDQVGMVYQNGDGHHHAAASHPDRRDHLPEHLRHQPAY